MKKDVPERSGIELVTEMLRLTKKMFDNVDDAELISDLIEKRGSLMEEYDKVKKNPNAEKPAGKDDVRIKSMVAEMIDLDKSIGAALEKMYSEAKHSLESSAANRKIVGYMNNAITPSSGNFFDVRK